MSTMPKISRHCQHTLKFVPKNYTDWLIWIKRNKSLISGIRIYVLLNSWLYIILNVFYVVWNCHMNRINIFLKLLTKRNKANDVPVFQIIFINRLTKVCFFSQFGELYVYVTVNLWKPRMSTYADFFRQCRHTLVQSAYVDIIWNFSGNVDIRWKKAPKITQID